MLFYWTVQWLTWSWSYFLVNPATLYIILKINIFKSININFLAVAWCLYPLVLHSMRLCSMCLFRGWAVLEVTKETEEKLVKEDEMAHRSVPSAATFTSQALERSAIEFFCLLILTWCVSDIMVIKVCLSLQGIPGESGKPGQDGKPVGLAELLGKK